MYCYAGAVYFNDWCLQIGSNFPQRSTFLRLDFYLLWNGDLQRMNLGWKEIRSRREIHKNAVIICHTVGVGISHRRRFYHFYQNEWSKTLVNLRSIFLLHIIIIIISKYGNLNLCNIIKHYNGIYGGNDVNNNWK